MPLATKCFLFLALIAGAILGGGIIGLVIGAIIGGNFGEKFTFNGVYGYEAAGQVGFIIGTVSGAMVGVYVAVTRIMIGNGGSSRCEADRDL